MIPNRSSVINLSLGSKIASEGFERLCEHAFHSGIPIVTAAGNDGRASPVYPCVFESTICVAAVNSDYQRYRKSNFGNHVNITAPGQDIESASFSRRNLEYKERNGTSVATPHVSGIVATIMSYQFSHDRAVVDRIPYEEAMFTKDVLYANHLSIRLQGFSSNGRIGLANNGINNRRRKPDVPYYVPPNIPYYLPWAQGPPGQRSPSKR